MYTTVLILASVSALALLFFVLTKSRLRDKSFPKSIRIVFFLLTLSGIFIVISESGEIDLFLVMRNWPTTEAGIISSRVEGKRAFHPEIIYEYRVGEKTYTGETDMGVPGFGTKANRLNVAATNVVQNPVGKIITVHYDPQDPSCSLLRIVPSYTVFILLSVGSLLLGAGLWGVLTVFTGKR